MKFLHLSDLHLGKRVYEYSMIEDQVYILNKIIEIINLEKPDGVIIAGDVYDKSVPSAEAVSVLNKFLEDISELGTNIFILSGNHDSPERIAFGGKLMEKNNVYMSKVYNGKFSPITLKDEYGEVDVWMLPFVRPCDVRSFENLKDENKIVTFTDALQVAISHMSIRQGTRNVLIAHQFVTGAERSESEENVGGLDNVDVSVFDKFDYVALGHIHKPQNISKNEVSRVRYCGTPLKYSLSEINQEKSITVVEIKNKKFKDGLSEINICTIPLKPLRDMRKIRGTYEVVISQEFICNQKIENKSLDDYIYVELTDEFYIPDITAKIRAVYKNLMLISYDNKRTQNEDSKLIAVNVKEKSPITLFKEFFKKQNGREMNEVQCDFMESLIKRIWENDFNEGVV